MHRRFLQLPAVAVSLLVVVGIVFGGVQLAGKYLKPKASNDYTGDGTGVVQVEVAPGDTSSDIAKTLVAADVVKSTTAFVDAAQDDPKSRDIQPGTYQLKLQMSAVSALSLLEDPTSLVGGRITIPEGTKLAKLKQLITSKSQIKAADLDAALANPKALGLPDYAGGKPEGFLFPATYNITSSTTATKLLTQMVNRYKQVSNAVALEAGAKKLGLSPYDVVKIASLIEAEVKRPQDYSQVAEVIINRLHRGMKLELDSTVNYALGTAKQFLTESDLKTESAYNTYLHKGLPPTPIDSPGQAALQAALNPATGNLLYFVTVDPDTGETLFTNSVSQFDKWRQQAQQNFSAAASAAASAKP
jgi:UPF0755 protein